MANESNEDEKKKKLYEKPTVLFSWDAPSRVHVERDPKFFTMLLVVSIIIGFVLVIFGQYTLMLVVFAFAFAIYSLNKFSPRSVHYQVLNDSIKIDDNQYFYGDLGVFWFQEVSGQTMLKVATYLNFPRKLELVIRPEDKEQIEDHLLHYLPYQEVKEGRVDSFIQQLVSPNVQKTSQNS